MTRRLTRALVTALVPLALVAVSAPAALASPVVEIDDTEVTMGQEVAVTGSGWPTSTMVTLELCGNAAMNGSADCDRAGATSVGVSTDGRFAARMTVGRPPVPCPCVVKVASDSAGTEFLAKIKLLGFPEVEPRDRLGLPEITRLVKVTTARMERTAGWASWFGAAPSYRLVVTLRNTGTVTLHDLPISFAWGKGAEPTGFVAAPDVPTLEAGAETTLEVPVTLDALAIGGYDVVGRIDGIGAPLEFRAHTANYPWGLILVPALVVGQLGLLGLRNRLRTWIQRRERSRTPVPTAPWPAVLDLPALERSAARPVPVPGDVAVLDLTALASEESAAPVIDLVALERFLATEADADDLLPNRDAVRSNVDIDLVVETLIDDLLPASQRRR